jgi:pantetheine-phosphate adenylyltransferase
MSKRIALFPGTFDPITIGHANIVERAAWIKEMYKSNNKVRVVRYEGLTVTCCQEVGANYILRGLRNMADFDYEKNIAQMNKLVYPNAETVFLMCDPAYTPISSSVVRDLIRNGGDASAYLPAEVQYKHS